MGRLAHAHQDGADGYAVGGGDAQQVVADVGGFHVRHDQQVGGAFQRAVRHRLVTDAFHQRGVALHLAVDFQVRLRGADLVEGGAHLLRRRAVQRAEAGVGQQRGLGRDAEALDRLAGHAGDAGQLLGAWVGVDVGVGDEDVAGGQDQRVHRAGHLLRVVVAEHGFNDVEVLTVRPVGAADHRVGVAAAHHHRADQRGIPDHAAASLFLRHALALGQLVVLFPVLGEARIGFVVDDLEVLAGHQLQAQLLDAHVDDAGAADQDWFGQTLGDDFLSGVQHALVLALGQHHAFRVLLGLGEHRLHEQIGLVHELGQLIGVGVEVLNRAGGDAGIHRGLGHGGGDLDDQARVERFRNHVFRAKRQFLVAVGGGHHVVLLGQRQIGDGAHRGQLHLFIDGGGAHVQRAAEDEGEAQHVVDLVRVVRTAGADDGVRANFLDQRRQDFRLRVGHGQDQRCAGHGFDHVLGHKLGTGQAHEDVGAGHGVGELALAVVLDRVAFLGVVQFLVAAFVDHALGVADGDVLALHAQGHQQVQAGDGGGAGAGSHHAYFGDILLHQAQAVEHCGGGHDGGAVLVVVEHRNIHAFAALLLDIEALGRFDVFKVDAAEGGLQRTDDVHQFVRVQFVDLDIEYVNAGELLEQHALAFHHRLAGQRADIAQAQHGGAVGDHRDQIAARSVFVGVQRIFHDGVAGGRHSRGVGQGEVALGGERLGRGNLDFARVGVLVVFQCALAQLLVHSLGLLRLIFRWLVGVRE